MRIAKLRSMFNSADRQSGAAVFSRPPVAGARWAALLVLALGAASPALAASQAEIRLRGTVPVICTVSVSNDTASLNLIQGEAGAQIATVTELCNAAAGYTVAIESSNSGRMLREGGGSAIPYTLSYEDAAAGPAGALLTSRGPSAAGRRSTLSASLPPSPRANAGTYSDTVTVSISAK